MKAADLHMHISSVLEPFAAVVFSLPSKTQNFGGEKKGFELTSFEVNNT